MPKLANHPHYTLKRIVGNSQVATISPLEVIASWSSSRPNQIIRNLGPALAAESTTIPLPRACERNRQRAGCITSIERTRSQCQPTIVSNSIAKQDQFITSIQIWHCRARCFKLDLPLIREELQLLMSFNCNSFCSYILARRRRLM